MRIEKTFNHQFGKVIERYHAFAREHNEQQEVTKATMLREPHLSKVKAITALYLKEFWNMMNSPIWADSDRVPVLDITRWDLANLCNCSRRAVQDHLARLSTYGIIEVEEAYTNGKNNGYKIRLNLWFLLGISEFKPIIKSHSEKPTIVLKTTDPSLLQTLPHLNNQKENLNNTDKAEDVDNLPHERHQEIGQEKQEIAQTSPLNQENNHEKNKGAAGDPGAGHPAGENIENPKSYSSDERFEAYRKGNLNKLRYAKAPVSQPKGISDVEKGLIVQNFWNFAKELFYPNKRFVTKIESEIKQVIRKDIFSDFTGQYGFDYWQIYNMRMQYWAEKKQAFDAKLDREAYFPLQYFAKEYGTAQKQGFLVVKIWERKAEKSLKEIEFERELERAKLMMIQYSSSGAVPRGQAQKIKDITQLAQYYYRKLSVKTNSEYVQKFNTFLTTSNFLKSCNSKQPQY
ncbi:hypothetical protein VB264_16905 [Arcicella aquatica]|uniref:Replication protein n=1 Tax=Arcicella aquatica TaxID=217141 RepID=A0ABU5QQW2_9BACT|nr:hypothetical protein [Arcicella aquatica]MEA5259482.1 hypothetical protein [Arcicella aquatica]